MGWDDRYLQQVFPLFEEPEPPLRRRLAEQLRALAAQNLFLGSSSWKYEGWLGSIYSRERYMVRGRFSAKQFASDCLAEYTEVFPIVSGDFAFYQFPNAAFWQRLFEQAPPPFRFAFKVPAEITVPVFANQPRYGARAGRSNPSFLRADVMQEEFLRLLSPYAGRVALLMFEFPASTANAFAQPEEFAAALGTFLAALPKTFRYAVEIRHAALLDAAYFRSLREHGVAHIFNSWTDMPAIAQQTALEGAFTTNFTAVRALMRPGTAYQDSLNRFEPFSELREPNEEVRRAIRELLVRAKMRAEPIFVFVNNRLEGFSPATIAAIIEGL